MKTVTLKNRLNNEIVICENIKDFYVIDGVEYLQVCKPGQERKFLMRKEALETVRVKNSSVKGNYENRNR
jgi:hypothetical protein